MTAVTTETRTGEISSRFAREETTAHWRCPAPDGAGRRCFRHLPCAMHRIDTAHIGMLLYGSSFLVPDSVEQSQEPAPVPDGWQPVGYVRDEAEAFVDEQLSAWTGMRTIVDPSLPPGAWGLTTDYWPQPWEHGPAAYPHPETGRLAAIAPWLTFDADGRTLDHG